jgi:hypothetical protein
MAILPKELHLHNKHRLDAGYELRVIVSRFSQGVFGRLGAHCGSVAGRSGSSSEHCAISSVIFGTLHLE